MSAEPKTAKGKKRKELTGDGRKRTFGEMVAKEEKEEQKLKEQFIKRHKK